MNIETTHKAKLASPPLPAIWFPTIKAGSGVDIFTIQLVKELNKRGIRAEIQWLPHHAEYFPLMLKTLKVPAWVNITHINSWFPSSLLPSKCNIVTTFHTCVHDSTLSPYKSILQKLYHAIWVKRNEAINIKKSCALTAVSKYTAIVVEKTFKPKKDILPIYNWIEEGQFYRRSKEKPQHPFKLLFVGKLRPLKGADILTQIMQNLGEDYQLTIAGDSSDNLSNSAPNIIYKGKVPREELLNIYNEADAFLFPSRLEGCCLSILEAQYCGLPIITSDTSSMPEIVNESCGFLCETENISAYTSKIRLLAKNHGVYNKLSSGALRNSSLYCGNVAVNKYISIYKGLLKTQES
ncbi:glycosyltransferase family 4 protein [Teredinibacter haidensis]|uniref:glycosyltransferase family 4 protein n=1 Tax=Teredinibacter haidensis TaxID=2731755 RepID=UPI000948D44B|nr:glycosyltransferase family 4 protein [Teredinibacter haidensis]